LEVGCLDVFGFLKCLLTNDLNPIPIRIQGKGDMLHPSISQLLLKFVAGILDALTRSLYVVDTYARVSETFVWLAVSSCDFVIGIRFGPVVMSELDEAFAIAEMIAMGESFGRIVAHKVKVELSFRLFNLPDWCLS
jgi:hypothetical protein